IEFNRKLQVTAKRWVNAILSKLLQKLRDPIDPLIDLLHAGRKAQADVRFETAVVSRNDRDVVLLEQRGGEGNPVGNLHRSRFVSEIGADVGEAIERPLRSHAGDLRQRAQSLP